MVNRSLRSLRSSTPRSISGGVTVSCYTSSTRLGMPVLMRKPLGSLPRSSGMQPNWLWTITWLIWPSPVPSIGSNTGALVGTREINHPAPALVPLLCHSIKSLKLLLLESTHAPPQTPPPVLPQSHPIPCAAPFRPKCPTPRPTQL